MVSFYSPEACTGQHMKSVCNSTVYHMIVDTLAVTQRASQEILQEQRNHKIYSSRKSTNYSVTSCAVKNCKLLTTNELVFTRYSTRGVAW